MWLQSVEGWRFSFPWTVWNLCNLGLIHGRECHRSIFISVLVRKKLQFLNRKLKAGAMAQDERARAGSRAKVFPARALWTRRLSGLRSLAAMGCASRFSAPTMDYNKRQLLEPFATARMPTFCMMAGDETRKEI